MVVEIKDPDTGEEFSYYLNPQLQRFLDQSVKDYIQKKDKDYVLLIDGYEGAGKSTFGQQIARYVDNKLKLSRVCMDSSEFKQAIINAETATAVIYDEAVTGMTAGDSITRVGKILKSMMMQMRQKNLFVIVIIPTIFELNKYTVLSRARCLFHIYENKGRMGYFVGYNKRDLKLLYLKGKQTYSYRVRSRFRGRFYGNYAINEEEYRKKKADALFKIDDEDEEYGKNYMRNNIIYAIHKEMGFSAVKLEAIFKKHGSKISNSSIGRAITDFSRKNGK